jgi:autotransporter-associated beta strand protein
MSVGSMEGNGHVFLGSRKLTVGSNNLNTTFSGSIQDGGANGGIGGSLAKTGTGELVLARRNTYTGGSIITRGHLTVNNQGGSATGSGPGQINGGFKALGRLSAPSMSAMGLPPELFCCPARREPQPVLLSITA